MQALSSLNDTSKKQIKEFNKLQMRIKEIGAELGRAKLEVETLMKNGSSSTSAIEEAEEKRSKIEQKLKEATDEFDSYNASSANAGVEALAEAHNKLLNICMMATRPATPTGESKEYKLLTSIEKDANGNYKPVFGGATINSSVFGSSFSKNTACPNETLSLLVLAIMWSMVCVEGVMVGLQMEEIQKIDDEIRKNNAAMKIMQNVNNSYSEKSTDSSIDTSFSYELQGEDLTYFKTVKELRSYFCDEVDYDFFSNSELVWVIGDKKIGISIDKYRADGDPVESTNPTTDQISGVIDVVEQGAQSIIAHAQSAARKYGEELSTQSSMMSTKMQRYVQDITACTGTASQIVDDFGQTLGGISKNVR
jgi:ElaB/YqjD/DUF883 family membrane-anchored ribosome-binding protein